MIIMTENYIMSFVTLVSRIFRLLESKCYTELSM
jgi:hypothetical protein